MNYNKKTILDVDVAGKKILLRCDFNVPQDKEPGAITSDKRIVAALPTIQYLLENVNRDVCARGGYGEVDKPALRQLVHHYVDLYAQTMIDGYDQKGARFR